MKIRESRKFLVLFCMVGFFLGIMYANLMSKDYITSMGIFNDFFLNQYSQTEIDVVEYIWYVAKIRITPVILAGALGCTKLRKVVVAVILLWTGFSGGMLMTSAVLKMGLKGLILCLVALMPHFVFYIAGYMILLWYFFTYPKARWNLSKTVSMVLFIAVGILLECYVNPVLMQMFLGTL
ncbi:stage II sporulation protein M [Bariatricus sp. SGI.154]|uniref:stage II sporulation protein M n=1 Tax=Bariatricus sp. SGI.154 TaxID=3420549 RepID=UPI003D06BE4E